MSAESNKQLIKRYLEALSGKPKPESVVAQYVQDEDLKHHIQMFEAAFPRYELRVDEMVAEGDTVAVRATFRGVQSNEFQGIRATGKEVTIGVMLFYRVAGDKIVAHSMNADSLGLLQQLGAVPALV
jgi:predicted ester cyclase